MRPALRLLSLRPGFERFQASRFTPFSPACQPRRALLLRAQSAMGAPSAAAVRAACRRLLPSIDLEVTTERMVRDMVSKELGGGAIDAWKGLIKVRRQGDGARRREPGQARNWPQRGAAPSPDPRAHNTPRTTPRRRWTRT